MVSSPISPDVPITEDPNGDSCVWEVHFEVVPVLQDTRCYLMRWDPAVSSFTEKDFETCVGNMERGMFRLDWSIFVQAAIPDFDWEKGHSGVLLSSDVTDRLTELWHPDQGFVNLFADPYVN